MSQAAGWLEWGLFNGPFTVALGLVAICHGIFLLRDEDRLLGYPWVARQWRARLVAWKLPSAADAPEVTRDLLRYQQRVTSSIAIGAGVVLVLGGAGLMALSSRPGGRPFPAVGDAGMTFAGLTYVSLLIGAGLGFAWAVHVGRRGAAGPRYADLHPRQAADYREPAWRWVGLALTAAPIGLTVASAAVLSSWLAFVLPAAMAVCYLAAELLVATAARAPRLVRTTDPEVARRCDDMVRAGVIGSLQLYLLFGLTVACELQAHVLRSLDASSGPLAALVSAVALVAALIAVFVAICDGRLGGRLTGWALRPLPS